MIPWEFPSLPVWMKLKKHIVSWPINTIQTKVGILPTSKKYNMPTTQWAQTRLEHNTMLNVKDITVALDLP
jgi:hypothetical protein